MIKTRRQHLMLFTACSVAWGACPTILHAQTATTGEGPTSSAPASAGNPPKPYHRKYHRRHPVGKVAAHQGAIPSATGAAVPAAAGAAAAAGTVQPGSTAAGTNATSDLGAGPVAGNDVAIDTVQKSYRELLLKEQNVPSAVSEVGQAQIQQTGALGSVQSLLKQTPSVNSYQLGVGQNTPELTVRGVRYAELSTTLNGIPINDLLSNGQGGFLTNNVGNPVDITQLSSVNVYPGTAPVDVAGFGTNGGTIAYETLKPTAKPYTELTAGIGSFDYDHYGFTENSGSIPGTDGLMLLLKYDQSENSGYIANTAGKFHNMLFSADKPYFDGTSHVTLDVIYNTGRADLPPSSGVPTDEIALYGYTYNQGKNQVVFNESDDYLTAILGDETYINDHLIVGGKFFYVGTDDKTESYVNPDIIYQSYPHQPNFQVPFYIYGPYGPTAVNTNIPFIGGTAARYNPPFFTNEPLSVNPGADPTNVDSYIPGEDANVSYQGTDTYGFAPKVNVFLPYNNITIGGLFAKETDYAQTYFGGPGLDFPQVAGDTSFGYGGGQERTVIQGYVQDRIDLIHNTLHFEPGIAWEGVLTTSHVPASARTIQGEGAYDLEGFDKAVEPYIGLSYDLPYHMTAYASYGRSASFPQITDYTLGASGSTQAPHNTLVHAYEGGIRYDTPRLLLNVDYFYQKTTSAIGFYANYLTDQFFYSNIGSNQYRGVEMNGQYRITPHLQVFATGSFNQADYLNNYSASVTPFQDQFGFAFKDTPLSSIPNWLANFGFSYENGPWSVRVDDQYTGEQFTTYNISVTNPNPLLEAATTTNENYKLPEFNTVNFLGSYTMPLTGYGLGPAKSVKFTLNAQNIFNTHYYAYRYLFNYSYAGVYRDTYDTTALIGPPASVIFDATLRF